MSESVTRVKVSKYRNWLNFCDRDLIGNSRIAIDAQKRALRQLEEYLDEGDNGQLTLLIEDAWNRRPTERVR